jgi:hypothetical protein
MIPSHTKVQITDSCVSVRASAVATLPTNPLAIRLSHGFPGCSGKWDSTKWFLGPRTCPQNGVTGKLAAPDPVSTEFTDNPTLQALHGKATPPLREGFTAKWTGFVNTGRHFGTDCVLMSDTRLRGRQHGRAFADFVHILATSPEPAKSLLSLDSLERSRCIL